MCTAYVCTYTRYNSLGIQLSLSITCIIFAHTVLASKVNYVHHISALSSCYKWFYREQSKLSSEVKELNGSLLYNQPRLHAVYRRAFIGHRTIIRIIIIDDNKMCMHHVCIILQKCTQLCNNFIILFHLL